MAPAAQRAGARAPPQGGAGGIPEAGAAPRACGALGSRAAVAGGRALLAGPSVARRPPRPGARPPQRRAAGLGLERARELQDAAGAVSRRALCQGAGLLLHLRPAGVPVRLAPRRFGRRPREPRPMARAVRRGMEVLERAERSGPAPEAPARTPLRDDRTAAPARRRGRPPRPAFPGFAPAPRPALARPPRLLGHAEPAGHQPARPRREMRRRSGRPGPLKDAPAALPFGRRRGLKTRWPGQARP